MQEKSENITKIIDRLKYYVDNQESNFNQLAIKIGVSNSYFSKMYKNKGDLGEEIICKILLFYENINPEWLITGSGEMLKSSKEAKFQNAEKANEIPFTVPLLPLEAIAGYNQGIQYEDCERYAVPEFEKSGVEFVIRMSGDSMYPEYSNGDILACRKINDILFFQWGKTYLIDSSQGSLVKRIFECKENPDMILLVSDNKEKYPEFSIPKSDIRSLSIVVGVIRMV